jgi:hypothetical protein
MIRKHTLNRGLVAALAITALAAPAAVARPDAPLGPLAAQHIRHVGPGGVEFASPDLKVVGAPAPKPVNAPGTDVAAGYQHARAPQAAVVHQDLRSPDSQDRSDAVQRASVPNLPTWPVDPKPIPAPVVQPVKDDAGTPWLTVGISLLVGVLALAGSAGTAGRIRRRARVAA